MREDFIRKTTVIRLLGAGDEGLGEDVTYDGGLQDAQQARGATLPLHGEWTIDSFSRHLEAAVLFPEAPDRHEFLDYRRWAFESAALDLALRQAGRSLGDVVGRKARPVTFVASGGLGAPPTTGRLRAFLGLYPTLRFKLDARPDWTGAVFAELQRAGMRRLDRPQGPVHRDGRRQPARSCAVPAGRRRVPRRLDRGPGADGRDRSRSSSRTPRGSRGMRPSTPSRTSRRSAGRRGRST